MKTGYIVFFKLKLKDKRMVIKLKSFMELWEYEFIEEEGIDKDDIQLEGIKNSKKYSFHPFILPSHLK